MMPNVLPGDLLIPAHCVTRYNADRSDRISSSAARVFSQASGPFPYFSFQTYRFLVVIPSRFATSLTWPARPLSGGGNCYHQLRERICDDCALTGSPSVSARGSGSAPCASPNGPLPSGLASLQIAQSHGSGGFARHKKTGPVGPVFNGIPSAPVSRGETGVTLIRPVRGCAARRRPGRRSSPRRRWSDDLPQSFRESAWPAGCDPQRLRRLLRRLRQTHRRCRR